MPASAPNTTVPKTNTLSETVNGGGSGSKRASIEAARLRREPVRPIGWGKMGARGIKLVKSVAGLGAAAALASCAEPPEMPLDRAETSGLTFVSLNPCLDAILVEVAAPDQILALSHYSRDQASSSIDPHIALQFDVTGGTAEEVLSLQPDIVLASTFIAPATRAALERSGLRVETFGNPATVDESADQVRALADLTGMAEQGAALAARIAGAKTSQSGEEITALLWQPGQIVPGETTLVAEHLRWAGLSSHSDAMGLEQADFVSLEQLLDDPPQILLVAGDMRGQSHPLLNSLHGTFVAEFPPNLFYCGGPSIPKARERLLEIREHYESEFRRELNSGPGA